MNLLSNRLNNLSESETLAMTQKSRELKAQGFDVINLSIGEPDFDTPLLVKDAAKKAIDDNFTHYTPVSGYPELREAICRKLKRDNGLDYTPAQIVVSTGAKQSIANVMLCLINPGDEVIVPAPYWVSYKEIVKLAEGQSVYVPAFIDSNFKVTPEQVEAAITPKTKAFIFSSPCNPTGSVYSKDELAGFAKMFARHPEIFIISDEIYEHINFVGTHESIAQFGEIRDRVIIVNGLSKGCAMTGWRIGFVAAPLFLAKACDKLQGQVTSGTCSIAQRAAIEAFDADPKKSKELQDMVRTFHERRDLMLGILKDIPDMKTNLPDGAFYIFANIRNYFGRTDGKYKIESCDDMANYLLEKVYVATVAGSAFGNPYCIRFSYATSNELLIEAANRIKKALAELK
mgnify:CR=1 FL=1